LNQPITARSFALAPDDAQRLANLCGQLDKHIKQIADHFALDIYNRGNQFKIIGDPAQSNCAQHLIERLYRETQNGTTITPDIIHLFLQEASVELAHVEQTPSKTSASTDANKQRITEAMEERLDGPSLVIKTPKALIKARGPNQVKYVKTIRELDINFGIGPAGTGKTYLAVACAVEALMADDVERILLVRPAVEAGEKLGFLPGDLAQKIDPYLRPLYDALYEMLGYEQVGRLIERNVIEIAPLAYMRGRTLSNAYVILDESQNTTREQMKMFLTRIGFGSKAVITGDVTQIDLPRGKYSGLKHAIRVLDNIEGIGFTCFANRDVVRHPLVQRIVDAYDAFETTEFESSHEGRHTKSSDQTKPSDQERSSNEITSSTETRQGSQGGGK
jgi:phosphate starvation-inducible PhoH-like protein